MWMLLPFLPLLLLESLLRDALSPVKELFGRLTEGVDFDRVFKD